MASYSACALGAAVTLSGVLVTAMPVLAQEFPVRTIRMVLPFPAGGGSDLIARIIAQKFSAQLGQQVVVDNRAGASGNIAADIVAKAPGDGYTVLFANSSLSISPAIYKKLSYDPVRDLTAISMASSYPFALVAHPALPVKSVRDLVTLAKSKPNSLDYSSAGTGTMSHMAMEEAGVPGHLALQWNGLFAPAKTPQVVQDKLYREWVIAVKSPEVAQRIRAEGAEPGGNTPAEFSAFYKAEAEKWADVAKQSGTTVE
ncbi:MAG: tripartite tricarboxylate transporter substrate-binding protein [Burkholderiales bacterium]|nr:tripartite tricarboxylate transporter substrate-binding protein [Burkholderiales bacterium]